MSTLAETLIPAQFDPSAYEPHESEALTINKDGHIVSPYKLRQVSRSVQLPCGYVDEAGVLHKDCEFVRMTGHEEDLLTEARNGADLGKIITKIVKQCVIRVGTITAGYAKARTKDESDAMTRVVDGLTVGDRLFLLVQIRRMSFRNGDKYRMELTCPACKKESAHIINLGDLVVSPMPDPGKRRYIIELDDGTKVVYRHMLCSDEANIARAQVQYKSHFASAMLWLAIETVNGDKMRSPLDFVDWSTYARDEVREAMDKTEGGVDHTIHSDCSKCGNSWTHTMEIGPSFFLPSAATS